MSSHRRYQPSSEENTRLGPNYVRDASAYSCVDAKSAVKLIFDDTSCLPISIPELLTRTALRYPDSVALCTKEPNGHWNKISYKAYLKDVRTCAKAFIHLGLQRRKSVCILGFNSKEWLIADLAAIHAGGIAVGIYTTNNIEACFYVAETSDANIIVVEDAVQLKKILAVRKSLPSLKAIIQYSGKPTVQDVHSWSSIMELGKNLPENILEAALSSMCINECVTLVYTSGTTGNPKAVMLSHDNLIYDAKIICGMLNLKSGSEILVSYLPLSHAAAQMIDIYCAIVAGAAVYFADKDAFKGTLINTVKEVRPTRFVAVPRVWEKIYEKMQTVEAHGSDFKKKLSKWARENGLKHYLHVMDKNNDVKDAHPDTLQYYLASGIYKKVKSALGLKRCKSFVTAAAPLSPDIKKYFMGFDIPIMEAFGMSETSGAHTMCTLSGFGFDTIGRTMPGTLTKIDKPDSRTRHGEICMNGRNIFMGYLNELGKTNEAIDKDGWLHSGDIGYKDSKGFIYITGRLKELLITSGGENVAPVGIEQTVKSEIPEISNCILIGDGRKFLSILVTLKTEPDKDTQAPTDYLTAQTRDWLTKLGCPAMTVTEVLKNGVHPKLTEYIIEKLGVANKKAPSNAQVIQKFTILPRDFAMVYDEVGPTLKLKRMVIYEHFKSEINQMYA